MRGPAEPPDLAHPLGQPANSGATVASSTRPATVVISRGARRLSALIRSRRCRRVPAPLGASTSAQLMRTGAPSRRSRVDRCTSARGGSSTATSNVAAGPPQSGMTSPTARRCQRGSTCRSPRRSRGIATSTHRGKYHPARRFPSCTIHGHTRSGGAASVVARSMTTRASGTMSSPGSGAATSASVTPERRPSRAAPTSAAPARGTSRIKRRTGPVCTGGPTRRVDLLPATQAGATPACVRPSRSACPRRASSSAQVHSVPRRSHTSRPRSGSSPRREAPVGATPGGAGEPARGPLAEDLVRDPARVAVGGVDQRLVTGRARSSPAPPARPATRSSRAAGPARRRPPRAAPAPLPGLSGTSAARRW
jgi:hypothetical protein